MPLVNVTSNYPPTVLVHGTADTDVPFEQSQMMANALADHGVPCELVPVEDGEHGFGGATPERIGDGYRAALRLFDRCVALRDDTTITSHF
jgi:dipeptidyl aminopeptidase/acylaminoacyl peptidase